MKLVRFAVCALAPLLLLLPLCARSGAGDNNKDQQIRDLYKNLIDAENRHDLPAVRELVWNSPSTLFVAKAPVGWHGYWGIDDVMQHLRDMYQQPFRIDPIYEEERVVFLTPEIAETYLPFESASLTAARTPCPNRSSWS